MNVSRGVVPSVPKMLMLPPFIVRFPVALSTWNVVLSGTSTVTPSSKKEGPPLVMVKNSWLGTVEPFSVMVFSTVSVPAILVSPDAPATVNLLNPSPVPRLPARVVLPVVDSTLKLVTAGSPPSVTIRD